MHYPGYPKYLADAAAALKIDPPDPIIRIAKKQPAVIEVSSLATQAMATPGGAHPDTLRKIKELIEGLYVAAEGMKLVYELLEPTEGEKPRPVEPAKAASVAPAPAPAPTLVKAKGK